MAALLVQLVVLTREQLHIEEGIRSEDFAARIIALHVADRKRATYRRKHANLTGCGEVMIRQRKVKQETAEASICKSRHDNNYFMYGANETKRLL